MLGKDRGFSSGIFILHFSLSLGSTLTICWEVPLYGANCAGSSDAGQCYNPRDPCSLFLPAIREKLPISYFFFFNQSPLESPPHSSWKFWFLRCQQGLWIQSQQRLLLAVKTHAMLPPAVQEGKCPAAAYAFGGLPQVFRMPFPVCCQPRMENAWSTCCIP